MKKNSIEKMNNDIATMEKKLAELKKEKRQQERFEKAKLEQKQREEQEKIDKELIKLAKHKTLNCTSDGQQTTMTFYDRLLQFYNEEQQRN